MLGFGVGGGMGLGKATRENEESCRSCIFSKKSWVSDEDTLFIS